MRIRISLVMFFFFLVFNLPLMQNKACIYATSLYTRLISKCDEIWTRCSWSASKSNQKKLQLATGQVLAVLEPYWIDMVTIQLQYVLLCGKKEMRVDYVKANNNYRLLRTNETSLFVLLYSVLFAFFVSRRWRKSESRKKIES